MQRKYILKFSTDGSSLTQAKGAVQSCIRLIDVGANGKPLVPSDLPLSLQQEILVLHYMGMYVLCEA